MDTVTVTRRSEIMAAIRSKDTTPELAVRRYLHAGGLRYRLHRRGLPGRPDIVFPSRRVCVFVHGCFWHGCPRCIDGRRAVKSNTGYWAPKIAATRERDTRHRAALEAAGWTVYEVWECETQQGSSVLPQLATTIKGLPRRQPLPAKREAGGPSGRRAG
jgi:DNA mismatch endonuclease (patch repair protein)